MSSTLFLFEVEVYVFWKKTLMIESLLLFSGMPTSPYLYAKDLNDVLKKKHASGTYKSLVNCQDSSEMVSLSATCDLA